MDSSFSDPPTDVAPEPKVVFWYRIYCGFMALLYLLCVVGGIALVAFREEIAGVDPDTPAEFWIFYGFLLLGLGVLLAGGYVASFFLPRRRWAWIFHIVLICIGLTSCCTMPAGIPLLIFWIKPETQEWFRQERVEI